jgi:prevent-host-death family protein
MKAVKIAELKDSLSEHLRAVERGAEVVVTDRNRPIARIVPLGDGEDGLSIEEPSVPFKTVRSRRFRPSKRPPRSSALLAIERGER